MHCISSIHEVSFLPSLLEGEAGRKDFEISIALGRWVRREKRGKKDPNLARKASIGGIPNGDQKGEKVVFSKTWNLVSNVKCLYILS